jgi:hypothetical protein
MQGEDEKILSMAYSRLPLLIGNIEKHVSPHFSFRRKGQIYVRRMNANFKFCVQKRPQTRSQKFTVVY